MALRRRNFFRTTLSPLAQRLLLSGRPIPGLTTTVYNGYELHTAMQAAGPDSSIILAPGTMATSAPSRRPAATLVRVRSPGPGIFRLSLIVNGDFVGVARAGVPGRTCISSARAPWSRKQAHGPGAQRERRQQRGGPRESAATRARRSRSVPNATNAYIARQRYPRLPAGCGQRRDGRRSDQRHPQAVGGRVVTIAARASPPAPARP